MTGKKQVELDVYTSNSYRKQGLAFETSLVLIKYLIDHNLEPNWTCWEQKESSRLLALKLGFKSIQNINAYIWVEDFMKLKK